MYKGQPLQLSQMLPKGMTEETFYTLCAVVLVVILGCATVLPALLRKKNRHARRVRMLQDRRAELRGEMMRGKRRKKSQDDSVNFMRQVVNRFQLLKSSTTEQVQNVLIEAGLRSKDAIVIYSFFALVTPVTLLLIGLILVPLDIWGTGMMYKMRYMTPIALAYLGLKLPFWAVARKRKKRYRNIQRALSDTLDLMTICAEAGLSLSLSLERVARELGIAYPEMAEELALTSTELGFLPDRHKAFINLTERVRLPEIRGIVSVLLQTEKYGTPISQAMRVLSAEFRDQRMLRAEAKAARLPALMTLPMILFILPTLFIVIITPAVLRGMDAYGN